MEILEIVTECLNWRNVLTKKNINSKIQQNLDRNNYRKIWEDASEHRRVGEEWNGSYVNARFCLKEVDSNGVSTVLHEIV